MTPAICGSLSASLQLLGIKKRAERYRTRTLDPKHPETGARDQFQLYQAIYASGEEVGVAHRADATGWHQAAIEDGVIKQSPDKSKQPTTSA